jgi:hypothetical protein
MNNTFVDHELINESRKQLILQKLEDYGIYWNEEKNQIQADDFREIQKRLAESTTSKGKEYYDKVVDSIAIPSDINILKVNPYLVSVESKTSHQRLWAYASSFWSIPISNGYGRRMRYFVFDGQNNKLIGILGLCDPVIGLGVRDKSIGWSKDQKLEKLYNCLTAYILGAIPPYNLILGSKLIALTVMFPEIRQDFYRKYKDKSSLISGENKDSYLVYVDTLGAFGKSAIYNRLVNWEFIDYTKGQSHLHITANGSWEVIKEIVPAHIFETYKFGKGPNWKMRILKAGLRELGLSTDMLSIGWQRAYYRCPLAQNWNQYLLGETDEIIWQGFEKDELVKYWYERWINPRIDILGHKLLQLS